MSEHYVTFFDHRFLVQGLALYESLQRHGRDSTLWVLCLDELAEKQLRKLNLPRLNPLSLASFETPELLAAKQNRSRTEYIFTLTPFTFDFVFDLDPEIQRITYVDADLFFYRDPAPLLEGFTRSKRHVLTTEHGYAPEFRYLAGVFGQFCVQFLTIRRTEEGRAILNKWQQDCLRSCSMTTRGNPEIYGDQKYLDEWPVKYGELLYIVPEHQEMLAPWNVDYFQIVRGSRYFPVFYHFHSLRVFNSRWIQLCAGFNPTEAKHLYDAYTTSLRRQIRLLKAQGIPKPTVPFSGDPWWLPRLAWRCIAGRAHVRHFAA